MCSNEQIPPVQVVLAIILLSLTLYHHPYVYMYVVNTDALTASGMPMLYISKPQVNLTLHEYIANNES